jgi:hypothetical protein
MTHSAGFRYMKRTHMVGRLKMTVLSARTAIVIALFVASVA